MIRPIQRDLFPAAPSRASPDARRSMPKERMVVEAFEFDEVDPRTEPRGIEAVPEFLRFWIDEEPR